MTRITPTPVQYQGELDRLNNRWDYHVTWVGHDGTSKSTGFVGTLAWARRRAGKLRRKGLKDVLIVGKPGAGINLG